MTVTNPTLGGSRRTLLAGGLGFALTASSSANVRTDRAATVHELPLLLSDYGLVFTWITVQGRPVRTLVDTGSASGLRLSERLAHELQIELRPIPGTKVRGLDGKVLETQRGRLGSLDLGDLSLGPTDFEVTGNRIETIARQVNTPFDAVLGWGLLARSDLTLDYPGRTLRLGQDASSARAVATLSLPYADTRGVPVVQGLVGGQPVRLLVDTGAPMCNLDAALVREAKGEVVERTLLIGTWSGMVRWRVKDLAVTSQALGSAATLGNNLLSRHVVDFRVLDQTLILR
jgi:predicted aspartyl protease